MTKQELFTKVTGLTFDVEKIPVEKLAWLIPDGSMLDSNNPKFELTKEFMEEAGLPLDDKVESKVERSDSAEMPEGEGWKKVIDVEAVEGVEEKWILNGVEYDEDPTELVSDSYDYVYDEASWNASEENGALKKYHEAYPSEDLWNTATNSAPGFNDKIYTVKMYTDAECAGEYEVKQFKAQWYSDNGVQKIIDVEDNSVEYYIPTFFDTPKDIFELFASAEGGYVATPDDLVYSCSRWIKVDFVSFDGENVKPSWQGAINAPGAQYPWVCPNFIEDVNAKVIFRYEGAEDKKPWGDKVFGANSWGCESVAKLYGDSFDIAKFQMILERQGVEHIEGVEAVEEQYHWERTIAK